eukprot:794435-Amphidinium_carterae.1
MSALGITSQTSLLRTEQHGIKKALLSLSLEEATQRILRFRLQYSLHDVYSGTAYAYRLKDAHRHRYR